MHRSSAAGVSVCSQELCLTARHVFIAPPRSAAVIRNFSVFLADLFNQVKSCNNALGIHFRFNARASCHAMSASAYVGGYACVAAAVSLAVFK
jgi:hypothetical protein